MMRYPVQSTLKRSLPLLAPRGTIFAPAAQQQPAKFLFPRNFGCAVTADHQEQATIGRPLGAPPTIHDGSTQADEEVGSPASWPSSIVFHDQAVLNVFSGVCQSLQISKPVEENRRVGDDFLHTIVYEGSQGHDSLVLEGRGRTKRAARKEAIRALIRHTADLIPFEEKHNICFQAAQQLILAKCKTGANSINKIFQELPEGGGVEAEVSFGELVVKAVGESEAAATLRAFDQVVAQLDSRATVLSKVGGAGSAGGAPATPRRSVVSAQRASTMISRHNTVAQRMRQNHEYHFEQKDGRSATNS